MPFLFSWSERRRRRNSRLDACPVRLRLARGLTSVISTRAVGLGVLVAFAFVVLLHPRALTALSGYRDFMLFPFGAMLLVGALALFLGAQHRAFAAVLALFLLDGRFRRRCPSCFAWKTRFYRFRRYLADPCSGWL